MSGTPSMPDDTTSEWDELYAASHPPKPPSGGDEGEQVATPPQPAQQRTWGATAAPGPGWTASDAPALLARIVDATARSTSDGNGGWLVPCGCHEDRTPSLHVWADDQGRLAHHCLAGCDHAATRDYLERLVGERLTVPPEPSSNGKCIVATYDYTDEKGQLLYQVVRYSAKDFRQRRPDGDGHHVWGLSAGEYVQVTDGDWRKVNDRTPASAPRKWFSAVERVLYGLHELRCEIGEARRRGDTPEVWIAEGEKDVDALRAAGVIATCNPGGAGKFRAEYGKEFAGCDAVIVADKDEPGRKHAEQVAASVRPHVTSVRIIEAAAGKDAADHLAAGKALDEFVPVDGGLAMEATEEAGPKPLPWMTAAELANLVIPEPQYICRPYLARFLITQLVGKTKGGKTEFVRRLVSSVLNRRPFLCQATVYAPVAYLTEESPASFGPPLIGAEIAGREDLHILFRNACPTEREWCDMIAEVRTYVREHDIGLLIIDTGDPWMLKVGQDPNDPVIAEYAVRQLQLLAAQGVAVIILRHERKGGGDISESGRGSTAFPGAVDVLMTLHRVRGGGHENRRELEAVARAALPDVPAKVVIELVDGAYIVVGDASDVQRRETLETLLDHLPSQRENALTAEALVELTGSAKTLAQDLLRQLWDEGRGMVCREKGAGNASSRAYGYWLRSDDDE